MTASAIGNSQHRAPRTHTGARRVVRGNHIELFGSFSQFTESVIFVQAAIASFNVCFIRHDADLLHELQRAEFWHEAELLAAAEEFADRGRESERSSFWKTFIASQQCRDKLQPQSGG